jgi:hypothetical protein
MSELLYVDELIPGGAYTTSSNRSSSIELFPMPHILGEAYPIKYCGLFYPPEEYFILLKRVLIHKTYWCVNILTSRNGMGWTAALHYNKKYKALTYQEVKIKDLEIIHL